MEYHTRLYVSVRNNIFIFQILITFVPINIYTMKKNLFISFFLLFVLTYNLRAQTLPTAEKTLKAMILINNHFMEKYADCTQPSNVDDVKRPSNI